jgi:hypothetical protein
MTRWRASVLYRHDAGLKSKVFDILELEEIHDLVEAGPHWGTVVNINITLLSTDWTLTVEEAAHL